MIIKSEQIANRVEEIIASRSSILKPNPTFSDNELQNIKNFLIEAHKNPLIEDKKFTNKFNKPDNITHQTEKK
ncbi:Uncharacterised protein [Vibrio cholerae]|nr:Uncharacterised protein [Vibrio cholerae]CSD05022.1 Uncharacterised protein [Vibrio cholerae]